MTTCPYCGTIAPPATALCPTCRVQLLAPEPQRRLGDDPAMRMLLPVGRSGWAIAAGYAGLFAFLVLPAPLALALGIVAIVDLRKHPDRHGWGRAVFGTVIGALGSIVLLAALLFA